ncbi:hypothetical protein [Streptomyces apocyni]|uniref:hypothetical protein n=1 Tax=Streptomyces apocyni TaxID=2654677 RepID=UPI0012E9BC27|nr:hypothetical protein [Streptomyces apocyni]
MTGTGLVTAQREVDGETNEITAHGRDEIGWIKAADVTGIVFPHAVQAVRRQRIVTTGKVALERVCGVTDLTAEQAHRPSPTRRTSEHRRWTPPPHPQRQLSTDHSRHHVIPHGHVT